MASELHLTLLSFIEASKNFEDKQKKQINYFFNMSYRKHELRKEHEKRD